MMERVGVLRTGREPRGTLQRWEQSTRTITETPREHPFSFRHRSRVWGAERTQRLTGLKWRAVMGCGGLW